MDHEDWPSFDKWERTSNGYITQVTIGDQMYNAILQFPQENFDGWRALLFYEAAVIHQSEHESRRNGVEALLNALRAAVSIREKL